MSMKTTTDLKGKIDFGIITIREDEYDAVLRRFPSDELVNGPNRIYSLTRVTFTRTFNYLIACAPSIEQGGGHAQDAARDMIEDLDPNLILLVGIAGAVPDVEFTLGDVVVAKRLHDFSVGAAIEGRNLQASNQGGPMHKLIQNLLAQLPALKKLLGDWNSAEQIGMNRPALLPDKISVYADEEWATKVTRSLTAHFGPGVAVRAPIVTARSIASGNILVKDTQTLRDWLERARELAAIEMELNGVYIAARRADREYPILAIRGISDIVGLQRDAIWTPYACEVAASCARAFVNAQLLAPRSDSGIPKISDLEPDPLRFEQFCNSLRDRRVGEGDDFGGDIVSGNIIGSETRLPKRALGGDALVLHFVPESAAIKPPIQADLAILQSHSSLLDDVQSWIDHSVNFKGYHYTLYPLKKRRRNADGLLLYTSKERERTTSQISTFRCLTDILRELFFLIKTQGHRIAFQASVNRRRFDGNRTAADWRRTASESGETTTIDAVTVMCQALAYVGRNENVDVNGIEGAIQR